MQQRSAPSSLYNRAQSIGLAIALLYWCIESAFDTFLFHKDSFLERLFMPDFNELWMRLLIMALIVSFASYIQSMHRQSRAEGRMRRKDALFTDILYLSSDGIIMINDAQQILLFNRGAEEIFGYASDEVMGKNMHILLPEGASKKHDRHIAAFSGGAGTSRRMGARESWLLGRRKNGEIFPADISISKLSQGKKVLFSAVVRDVTDQKRAEEAIHKLNCELEQRVIERTAELTETNKELETFCYSVSHDLRAPLRGITGFSEALKEDYGDKLDARGLDYLQRTSDAGKRMGELIDELLTLSRVTRQGMHLVDIDLSAMCRELAAELDQHLPERDIRWEIEDGVRAKGDLPLVRAVLQNLLENACKFTGKKTQAEIHFGQMIHAGKPAYFVRDNGVGFDMAYSDKLFGPFQRLHRVSEFPGNGIGLATVQRIIRRHGGQVWAKAELDKGATFYFSLSQKKTTDQGD